MVTERTLKRWRKEALEDINKDYPTIVKRSPDAIAKNVIELQQRILRLTQELLDQHLMRRDVK